MIHSFLLDRFRASSQLLLDKTFSNLSSIKITELETNDNWRIIDLSHNSIEFVDFPNLLQRQIYLETLRLNSNSAFNGRTNKQIFAHKTLKNFECKECGFEEVQSQHFSGLVSLTELFLNANRINRISEDAFKSNGNLKLVDLRENMLKSLPPNTFAGLRSFEDLTLTSNPIELPKSQPFLKSESLKHLKIDDCNMPLIYPETLNELRNLEALNLDRNEIKSLPVNSFKSNPKLKSLLCESNQMRSFPLAMLDMLPQLEELCIDINKFVEDADFEKFHKKYDEMKLRTDNCGSNSDYNETLTIEVTTDVPLSRQNSTEKSEKILENLNQGISDFFIGSYITMIIILQVVAFVLLSIYLIKISKYEKLDGDVNYANTILNDDEIYKVYKSNE